MDRFVQDLPYFGSYDPPQLSSRPQHDWPTFYPPSPNQPIHTIRKITPPEDKEVHARDDQYVTAKGFKSPYDEAYSYIENCRRSRLGNRLFSNSQEILEMPRRIKMPTEDWVRLCHDFNLGETDEA
jgi:hypothetical protein